jgi:hypothetical protein
MWFDVIQLRFAAQHRLQRTAAPPLPLSSSWAATQNASRMVRRSRMDKKDKKWKIPAAILVLLYLLVAIGAFVVLTRYFCISDISDVGQLFADVLLFPTVVIGFCIAITEFRKSRALPDLKLLWQGDAATKLEGDSLVLETSKYDVKTFFLTLFVRNDGASMATWYRINFDVPGELARPNSDSHTVQWHRGEQDCWSSGVNPRMTRHEFKSNGQYALYPGDEAIHIATLEVRLFPHEYPSQVQIHYSVVTDRTEIQHGVCKIKIRPENPALEIQQH